MQRLGIPSGKVIQSEKRALPWAQITHYQGDQFDHTGAHIIELAPNLLTFTLQTENVHFTPPFSHHMRHLDVHTGWRPLDRLKLPALERLCFSMQQHQNTGAVACLLERSGAPVTDLSITSLALTTGVSWITGFHSVF
ncbi:hypothetical protein DFH07DRAFT_785683 [Mycena maculata]|uniref:Uncharacterized protein n=1 Tax=Mycena maculata TaxID=230809 RepID=A0AAD7H928_9AGAR|nr:hypothetical protein DFH07DRAFT_785683 [Mycena maculata]